MEELKLKQIEFNKAMDLYETKPIYQRFSKLISFINVFGQIILLVIIFHKGIDFSTHFFAFILAFILADFWNGLVHMYMDNYDNYSGFLGPFVASFHLHHRTPLYRRKPVFMVYFDESGSKIWMAFVEILIIAIFLKLPDFYQVGFAYFFILSSFAELSHYFCHTVDGKFINFLQSIGFILNKKHHAIHHMKDNKNYAFLNGISDPLINLIADKYYKGYKNGTDRHYETYVGSDTKNR